MNHQPPRRPIVVLISGRGSNMRALIEDSSRADSPYEVAAVLSDKPDAAGLGTAAQLGIPARAIDGREHPQRAAYELELADAIRREAPELVVLAGFMRILSASFVGQFADRIFNVHPSLLPAYPGLHTHRRVLAAGEPMHGATVHYVTADLDAGPAVLQARLAVTPAEDEASLALRVQALEHRMYPRAVRWHCEGRLACLQGTAWFDGQPLATPMQLGDTDA